MNNEKYRINRSGDMMNTHTHGLIAPKDGNPSNLLNGAFITSCPMLIGNMTNHKLGVTHFCQIYHGGNMNIKYRYPPEN